MIRLIICDDHTLVSEGIELILRSVDDIMVVKTFSTGKETIDYLLQKKESIDILILDISMPEMNGIEVLKKIHSEQIHIPVLMLTMHDKMQHIQRAIQEGAKGYLLKNADRDTLVQAIRKVAMGKPFFDDQLAGLLLKTQGNENTRLTNREREILILLAEGKTTKEIATMCYISVNTVLSHKKNIYAKLHIHSVQELINYAYKHHYI